MPCMRCKLSILYGIRGLCQKCYHVSRRDVRLGQTTWAELEAAGTARAALPKGDRCAWIFAKRVKAS